VSLALLMNYCSYKNNIMVLNQTNHRFSTKMQRGLYGHATDAAIRPLNEEKAVQAAADLLGELFVFTVLLISSSLFVYNY
jgi:hypothetical protein